MQGPDLTALDRTQILALVEKRVRARRAGEVFDMQLAVQWCGLNSDDSPGPARRGAQEPRR